MKKIKVLAILLCAVLMTGILAGCMYDSEETQYTNELKTQIQDSIGFPNITNFFEYSQLKESSQEARGGGSYWNIVPLAEPNGLYTESVVTTATWILTSVDGEIKPTYVESEITVSQTKLDARLCEDWSIPDNY